MSTVIAKNVQVGADGTASNNFTVYQPATPDGTLRIGNGNSGTTSNLVAVTSAGNVGIGTSSPAAKLGIVAAGDGTFNSQVVIAPVSGANPAKITFNPSVSSAIAGLSDGSVAFYGNGANTERMRIDSNGQLGVGFTPLSTQGNLQVYKAISGGAPATSGTTDANQVMGINASSVQLSYGAYANGNGWIQQRAGGNFAVNYDLVLQPNGGNLLVGTTTNTYNARLVADGLADNVAANFYRAGTTSASAIVTFVSNAGGTRTLKSYIDVSSGALITTSDESQKENLVEIENAAAKVCTLRAVVGNYIGDDTKHPFLIAQDVQRVLPEAVSSTPDGKLGMSYTDIIPLLVKAIQEQQAIITDLTARIEALEAK